jgi:hypothetical protein
MVYNTQNYWVYGLCISPGILKKLEITTFRKLDLSPFSNEGRETSTMSGPLETANLNNWTTD